MTSNQVTRKLKNNLRRMVAIKKKMAADPYAEQDIILNLQYERLKEENTRLVRLYPRPKNRSLHGKG